MSAVRSIGKASASSARLSVGLGRDQVRLSLLQVFGSFWNVWALRAARLSTRVVDAQFAINRQSRAQRQSSENKNFWYGGRTKN